METPFLVEKVKSCGIRVLGGPCRRLSTYPRSDLEDSGPGGVRSRQSGPRGIWALSVDMCKHLTSSCLQLYNQAPEVFDMESEKHRFAVSCRFARDLADHCYVKRPRPSALIHQLVRVRE